MASVLSQTLGVMPFMFGLLGLRIRYWIIIIVVIVIILGLLYFMSNRNRT